jgi:site-specific DNA-cytosine methylase
MALLLPATDVEIRHFHLFCGLGGGARGFNRGTARVGHLNGRFRCVGGVDADPAAIRDFERLAQAKGTVLDLFSREQYTAFHGHEPPADWREATPVDIQRAAGFERPRIGFGSAPCKGFSGLLSESRSLSAKYQALNQLALRGLWLALEAWKDDPLEFWLWENVPRIQTRGRPMLDQMIRLLESYGYAVAETTHDCGELGELKQHRKRFLLVARHRQKVPPFLYEPPKRRVGGVGEVIGKLPVPGPDLVLPMHRLPSLQWPTWVRLALVEAGSDWRSLNRLRVADGVLQDFALMPSRRWFGSALGVTRFDEPAHVVTSEARPQNGQFAVADPRVGYTGEYGQIGVKAWDEASAVVNGQMQVGGGPHAVADPRILGRTPFHCQYRVVRWEDAAPTITAKDGPSRGQAVADPRSGLTRAPGAHYQNAGQAYGVVPWAAPSGGVTAAAGHDNGRWSVADPRPRSDSVAEDVLQADPNDAPICQLPAPTDRLVACIQAIDGTYHRPFTTLELAALQSLVDPDELFELNGKSDAAWRERIGNAVPPDAAAAIASVMGQTLLLAWTGETFVLSATPVWVRPVAVALSVATHSPTA